MDRIRQSLLVAYLLWGVILLSGGRFVFDALAQDDADVWPTPVNISQSGTAVNPVMAADGAGTFYLLWQEPSVGFVFSSGDGRQWSEPVSLRLPFSEPGFFLPEDEDFEEFYTPEIVIDAAGVLHGFWLNSLGALLYSRAPVTAMADQASWTFPVTLAESAVALDVMIDDNGRFHLSYIRPKQTSQFPAGIYYRRSENNGADWTDAASLYQSQYLSATPDQAHVKIIASGDDLVLVWDDRLLDSVFVTLSKDGGASWDAPFMVDGRTQEDDPKTMGPSHIDAAVVGDAIHLTWQAEHTAGQCGQYHQWSLDRGVTWQPEPALITASSLGCPTAGRLISAQEGLLFLLTRFGDAAYLQVWDETQWSQPELQTPLAVFTNPQTFRLVDFGCYQPAVLPDNQLLIAGCGRGEGDTADIWVVERPLGVLSDWSARFAATPVWSTPAAVASSPFPFSLPELVAAGDGRLHAFWSQPAADSAPGFVDPPANAIYYTRLNADQTSAGQQTAGPWSPPRPVLTSPDGQTNQPSVAADAAGNLFVVWSGGQSGQIYFSRAVADRASSVTEWTTPLPLPSPRPAGSWPEIVMGREGTLFVTFAVPLNEDRGIYLTQSTDGGDTWTVPTRIFDGIAAGWEMVGQPHLALTDSSEMHLIWSRRTLPGGVGPLALVYARSEDGGQSWSEPELLVQKTIVWSGLVAIGERSLHLAWLSLEDGRLSLTHQSSTDNGLTWSSPESVFTPDVLGGPAALIKAADGPHLLQLGQNVVDGQQVLQEWRWQDDQWQPGESLALNPEILKAGPVTAVAAPDGRFGVIYAHLILNETSGQLQNELFYTERAGDNLAAAPSPLPTLTPTPPPLPTEPPRPEPSPTPTVSLASDSSEDGGLQIGPFNTDSQTGSLILSLIPAVLLVLIVFVVRLRTSRTR